MADERPGKIRDMLAAHPLGPDLIAAAEAANIALDDLAALAPLLPGAGVPETGSGPPEAGAGELMVLFSIVLEQFLHHQDPAADDSDRQETPGTVKE